MAKRKKNIKYIGLPVHTRRWFFIAAALSLLLHLGSYVKLDDFGRSSSRSNLSKEKSKVKINIVPKNVSQTNDDDQKKILETRQEKTEAPENARYKGAQDHKTDKETKLAQRNQQERAQDPGQAGQVDAAKQAPKPKQAQQAAPTKKPAETPKKNRKILSSPDGTVPLVDRIKPRNPYESLMPNANDLRGQMQLGYQDYVDDDVEVGDRIDLNTTNYRYIGYFTSVRKAFELVWTYPAEAARRGLQGEVSIQFTILKDGRVRSIKVLESSGHSVLDDAVIEAIRLSSPYSPLPDGFEKDKLTVVGSFRYVLSSYAGAY